MTRFLVTGALGQIGTELVPALRRQHGADNVIACDRRPAPDGAFAVDGPFSLVDCTACDAIGALVRGQRIDTIYHLAGVLSARAEDDPRLAWEVNVGGLLATLDVAREHGCQVFFPSSIGAFGPATPKDDTPQDTIQRPTKIYGITKVAGELLGDYYAARWGVDVRGLRYPGIISNVAPPGGGTTDYAVEIFYAAVRDGRYTCPLKPGTFLDMMYMPDALDAAINLMAADPARLVHRCAFNVTAMSFEPETLATEIRKHLPHFVLDYRIDPVRQAIADSWPNRLDDAAARAEWGWRPRFDLPAMVRDMLAVLTERQQRGTL